MLIIIGEILLASIAVYFCLVLLEVRNPQNTKWWTKPWMIEYVHIYMILCSVVLGIGILIKGLLQLQTTKQLGLHAAGFFALIVCIVLVVKKMQIKRRLAEFDAMAVGGAEVTAMPLVTDSTSEHIPPVPKAA